MLSSIHVTTNLSNDEATDINYPIVRLSGPVGIFLIWTLSKTMTKTILSLLLRRLIQEKQQVLPRVRSLRKNKPDMDAKFCKELTSLRAGSFEFDDDMYQVFRPKC
jgi:hypothetical protein